VIGLVSKVFSLKYVQVGKEEKVKKFMEKRQINFSQMGQKDLLIFKWNLQNGFYKDFIFFIFKKLIVLNILKSKSGLYSPNQD